MNREILRYAAFTVDGQGGNPAGIVLDATGMTDAEMLAVAAEIGYSETAFLLTRPGEEGTYDVRYFAPEQEVPFCGHATIATGVALAERGAPADLTFHTPAGEVALRTSRDVDGPVAELTSIAPTVREPAPALVEAALAALHWSADQLDPGFPVAIANAGANHLVLVVRSRQRLADLAYDFGTLAALMREHDLITLQLVWPEFPLAFHARDPFPPGGVVEDPATGAAAAALGAYLRDLQLVPLPATVTIHQGEDLGRPGHLVVGIRADRAEIEVTGTAVAIT